MDNREKKTVDPKELVRLYQQLDEAGQQHILQMIGEMLENQYDAGEAACTLLPSK